MAALASMLGMGGGAASAAGAGAGAGVTAGGLGSGALGTGMTGSALAAAPAVTMGSTGALTGALPATLGSTITGAMPYVQGAQSIMNLIGPQGSLSNRGSPMAAMNDFKGVSDSYDKIMSPGSSIGPSSAPSSSVHGSKEVLGRADPESFKSLPPDIQKQVLKILMGNN